MFEVFEHTADLGLRIVADSPERLLAEGAQGLFAVIAENLSQIELRDTVSIQVAGDQLDYLLFDWLTELLFLFETKRWLLAEFDVQLDSQGLSAVCRGEPYDPDRHRLAHEVKAITYHGLQVQPFQGGWRAEVIVDI